jgi:hypothetical protein
MGHQVLGGDPDGGDLVVGGAGVEVLAQPGWSRRTFTAELAPVRALRGDGMIEATS